MHSWNEATGDDLPRLVFACDEVLARVLLPEIQAFFESENGQREYAEWKAQQQAEQENEAFLSDHAPVLVTLK